MPKKPTEYTYVIPDIYISKLTNNKDRVIVKFESFNYKIKYRINKESIFRESREIFVKKLPCNIYYQKINKFYVIIKIEISTPESIKVIERNSRWLNIIEIVTKKRSIMKINRG